METAGYFRVLRRHVLLVIASAIIGIVLAAGVAQAVTPSYRAQATLFLKVQAASTSLYERSQFALQRVQSYPQLLESPTLLNSVIDRLSLHTTPQQLAKAISASNPPNTVLVNVTADAAKPEQAADIANAAADELAQNVNTLENSETTSKNAVVLTPQIQAQPPQSPSSPNVPVLLGLGALIGLVLGYLLALLMETLRPTMRTADEVRRVTGLPVVAQLPSRLLRRRAAPDASPAGETAAMNLRALGRGVVPPVLLLAPASRGAAKPLVRYVLARGLADTGRRVVVVETDATETLPHGVSVPGETSGLSELLVGRADPSSVVVPHAAEGVDVVPVGDRTVAPSPFEVEHVIAGALSPIITAHDTTVLQASEAGRPVTLSSLAATARGALIVVSARSTKQQDARRMLARLRVLGLTPIGVVMIDTLDLRPVDLMETWHDDDFVRVTAAAEPSPVRAFALGEDVREGDRVARPAGEPTGDEVGGGRGGAEGLVGASTIPADDRRGREDG